MKLTRISKYRVFLFGKAGYLAKFNSLDFKYEVIIGSSQFLFQQNILCFGNQLGSNMRVFWLSKDMEYLREVSEISGRCRVDGLIGSFAVLECDGSFYAFGVQKQQWNNKQIWGAPQSDHYLPQRAVCLGKKVSGLAKGLYAYFDGETFYAVRCFSKDGDSYFYAVESWPCKSFCRTGDREFVLSDGQGHEEKVVCDFVYSFLEG